MINEKWMVYTKNDMYVRTDINLLCKLESELREEQVFFRTIYYVDNKPMKYDVNTGLTEMTYEEKKSKIEEVYNYEQ